MNSMMLGLAIAIGAPAIKDPPPKKDAGIYGEWVVQTMMMGGKQNAKPPAEMIYQFTPEGQWLIRREAQRPRAFRATSRSMRKPAQRRSTSFTLSRRQAGRRRGECLVSTRSMATRSRSVSARAAASGRRRSNRPMAHA